MARPRNSNPAQSAKTPSRLRCAIYTRKSSEEGLEQEFNSLDAQREACEAYITSQKHEGWNTLRTLYDDGAYSGATMDRPALQRLLDDILVQKIDVVVVYKVDRLTRSLADFAKIVEIFDKYGVSFVSVTQAFNTTSSMGRLTLNVLLSFAQFEREVTGERIRDKIAASKKKGMWMGGLLSLGYNVQDRKLVINEPEAKTVRHIFQRYLVLGSVRALKEELDDAGIVSKIRFASDGSQYGGKSFSRGALYLLLQNRIYRGEIVHKCDAYPGQHDAIIDEELWSKVQKQLENNRIERQANSSEANQPSLLTGLLLDANTRPMTPTHAVKKGTRYRYYISRHLVTGTKPDKSSGQRIPAKNLEHLVVNRIRSFFADNTEISNLAKQFRFSAPDQKRLTDAAQELSAAWEVQPTRSLHGLLRSIITQVQVHADRIEVAIDPQQIKQTLLNDADQQLEAKPRAVNELEPITISIATRLKRTGKELKFVVEGKSAFTQHDPNLIRLLVRARKLGSRLFDQGSQNLEEIAREQEINPSYATRLIRLNFLAPDIVVAILDGKQPTELTAGKLMADTRLPLNWKDQRTALGFV